MTRNPSVDYAAAHRRYVFGKEPISLSELAVEVGCSRAALAAKAAGAEGEMTWYDQRREFESRIGEKTMLALADEWATIEAENRKKRMETANAVLDKFILELAGGTAKIGSKEALEWVQLMRAEFEDVRNMGKAEHPDVVEGEAVEWSKDAAQDAYDQAMETMRLLNTGTDGPD